MLKTNNQDIIKLNLQLANGRIYFHSIIKCSYMYEIV